MLHKYFFWDLFSATAELFFLDVIFIGLECSRRHVAVVTAYQIILWKSLILQGKTELLPLSETMLGSHTMGSRHLLGGEWHKRRSVLGIKLCFLGRTLQAGIKLTYTSCINKCARCGSLESKQSSFAEFVSCCEQTPLQHNNFRYEIQTIATALFMLITKSTTHRTYCTQQLTRLHNSVCYLLICCCVNFISGPERRPFVFCNYMRCRDRCKFYWKCHKHDCKYTSDRS